LVAGVGLHGTDFRFSRGHAKVAASPAPPTSVPVTVPIVVRPPTPLSFEVADAAVPVVPLFESPGAAWAGGRTLKNPTVEHIPLVFLVRQDMGDWLNVQIPARPNGTTAWVHRSDVKLRTVANHILVELGARRLTVLHGDEQLVQDRVAIGAPSGPTPTGNFYVDGVVRLKRDTGPYGAGQLSVAGFSDVYHTFGAGIGEIALHGTNSPALIGGTVSHGCVRMLNGTWLRVADLAPSGTPVDIVA
jgi:lipoprotein-anchoring transpeptidase ErfK/SrfK